LSVGFSAVPISRASTSPCFWLATLILRPVAFEFRNKVADARWRAFWDYSLFAGGLVPSAVFGVAFGNLLQGVPTASIRTCGSYSGLFELLNAYGLLCGLVSAATLATHRTAYLALKTDDRVRERARLRQDRNCGHGHGVCRGRLMGVAWNRWLRHHQHGHKRRAVEPALKTLVRQPGQWRAKYAAHHWMIAAPCLGVIGPLLALLLTMVQWRGLGFIARAVASS
jgi:cytochrome bd ubiquinol oxidase subunit II